MDLSVSAAATTYLPAQAYSQQVGAAVAAASPAPAANVANQSGSQANTNTPQSSQPLQQQLQAARKKSPATEVTNRPGYNFEVDQQNHKVMKVSDNKGVLIYQVPSKGELALITARESEQKRLQLTA